MLLFTLFTTLAIASGGDHVDLPTVETRKSLYLASNSICVDGVGAIISGHGCKNMHILDIEKNRTTIQCVDESPAHVNTVGLFTIVPVDQTSQMTSENPGSELMCVDSNIALFRSEPK